MAKPEIQSTIFASRQSITHRGNAHDFCIFYTLLKLSNSKTVISLMTS